MISFDEDDAGEFFDALDEFPFEGCESTAEPYNKLISISHPEQPGSISEVSLNLNSSTEFQPLSNLRRHMLSSRWNGQEVSGNDSNVSCPRSSVSFSTNDANSASESFEDIKLKFSHYLNENGEENECLESVDTKLSSEEVVNDEKCVINKQLIGRTATNGENDQSAALDSSPAGEIDKPYSSSLFFIAGMVVKAMEFQINLFISTLIFPLKLMHCSYMFVFEPFLTMRRGRDYFFLKMWGIQGFIHTTFAPSVYAWLKEHKSVWKPAFKFSWGLLWSFYVCVVLVIMFVSAFVMSGLVMRYLVEEPIQVKDTLNFDYTESSPVAFVPIMACPDVSCGMDCKQKVQVVEFPGARVIPPNHKLQVTVSLVLPESDYNRNLGMFQLRVDFLSANGKVLAGSQRPCMLLFKSQPIRFLLTLLKIAPLITGYASESQNLNIKFEGFTEGGIPTTCLRVTIEQRAEFRPRAGIPEIYSASLYLESELPLLRRFLWYWKTTLFLWISMTMFTMQLIFTLLCCKPIIMPRIRLRYGSAKRSVPESNHPGRR